MKSLCKCIGGSRLYNLETPQSDYDERGIFLHSNLNYILDNDFHKNIDKYTYFPGVDQFHNNKEKINGNFSEIESFVNNKDDITFNINFSSLYAGTITLTFINFSCISLQMYG